MNPLRFMRYPALVCLGIFWTFAALDFVCSLASGNDLIGTWLDSFGIARFGVIGAASLGLGVLFYCLYALRDSRIARALYQTALLAFASTGLFELGIRLTDPSEFGIRVFSLQILFPWSAFFTNSFLLAMSLGALAVLGMALVARPSLIAFTLHKTRGGEKNG